MLCSAGAPMQLIESGKAFVEYFDAIKREYDVCLYYHVQCNTMYMYMYIPVPHTCMCISVIKFVQ